MPTIKVTKEEVQQIVEELVHKGFIPTQKLIRQQLGKGSCNTIQKYLLAWKKVCFKKHVQSELIIDQVTSLPAYDWKEEKRILEQSLSKQMSKNENYVQELINTEKANIALKEENYQLQNANQGLQLKLTAAEATNHALAQVTQKIQNELNLNANETIQKMHKTIDELKLELKTLNEISLSALRDTSNKGHEVLMQEKVASINLQAKIDSLTKELLESKKQSHEAIMAAQVQNKSLLRQNKQLQKIIQEHGLDKLPLLDEELSLKFSKEAAAYGK